MIGRPALYSAVRYLAGRAGTSTPPVCLRHYNFSYFARALSLLLAPALFGGRRLHATINYTPSFLPFFRPSFFPSGNFLWLLLLLPLPPPLQLQLPPFPPPLFHLAII